MIEPFKNGPASTVAKLNQIIAEVNRQELALKSSASNLPKTLDILRGQLAHNFGGVDIRIFEVQEVATGDGLYTCYLQKLDATNWASEEGADKFADLNTTEVTVFNLYESAGEGHDLAEGDRLAAWQITDDESTSRWVGLPLKTSGEIRLAFCSANAADATTIACYLDADGVGDTVTVNFDISGGGNCEDCIPLLKDGSPVYVQERDGDWYALQTLQTIGEGLTFDENGALKVDLSNINWCNYFTCCEES